MADFDDILNEESFSAEDQAKEAAFLKEVKKRRVVLMNRKKFPAEKRLEAAHWLGEAGDPSAIPDLVKVYQKDKTPGMKEAAEYSLGMMKALGEALEDPQEADQARELIQNIILEGKFGGEGRRLRPFLALLTVTFIVFLGIALALSPSAEDGGIVGSEGTQDPEATQSVDGTEVVALPSGEAAATESVAVTPSPLPPSATPTPQLSPEEELAAYYAALQADAAALHDQFLRITRQSQMQDCTYPFNDPEPYVVPVGVENPSMMEGISVQLNEVRDTLSAVRAIYITECSFRRTIDRQVALDQDSLVIEAQSTLTQDIQPRLVDLGVAAPTGGNTNPDVEPTQDISSARVHISTLEDIIASMTGLRGEAVRIQTYWSDIEQFGRSEGCFQSALIIPEAYTLPEDVAADFPTLQTATDLVNLGLGLTQQSADGFFAACESDTLGADLETYQEQANGAVEAFLNAQILLDALLSGA